MLGDLTIDGGRLSPKERSLLAALVLRAGSVVTPPELADAVWSEEPPNTWPKQVQAFVVHGSAGLWARRRSPPHAVATDSRVDPDSIDAVRYERLIEQARTPPRERRPDAGHRRARASVRTLERDAVLGPR